MNSPPQIVSVSIQPRTGAGRQSLPATISALLHDDRALRVSANPQTGQISLSSTSELQLSFALERIQREFGIDLEIGQIRVLCRETIQRAAEYEYEHKRTAAGTSEYAAIRLRVEPSPGFEFVNELPSDAIPAKFIQPIQSGIERALERGVLTAYPIIDLRVRLLDAAYHESDTSDTDFQACAFRCVIEAVQRAGPVLLEPVMRTDVLVPEVYMGSVIDDLNYRRGCIETIKTTDTDILITATVPLSCLLGYAADLRTRTEGQGRFSMCFDCYALSEDHDPSNDDLAPLTAPKLPKPRCGKGSDHALPRHAGSDF